MGLIDVNGAAAVRVLHNLTILADGGCRGLLPKTEWSSFDALRCPKGP
jgi:hypothetical protein